MADPLPPSSSPDNHIPTTLAALSCISFAAFFVGSLYIFPLKSKLPREHGQRHLDVHARRESRMSSDTLPHRRMSTATTATTASDETPPSSPRPSTSSSRTAFINHSQQHLQSNSSSSSRPHSIHTDTIILTTKTPVTNAKGVADNRAHRSSTHLHFMDSEDTSSATGTTTTTVPVSASSKSLIVPPVLASTLTNVNAPSTPSPSTPTVSSFSIPKPLFGGAPARPEVVNHHSSSSSSISGFGSSQPAMPARLQALMNGDNPKLDRDHPLVIIQRFKGILLTCFLIPFYLWWIFNFSGAIDPELPFWSRLGLFLNDLGISIPNNFLKLFNHAVIPLFLVGVLFMGPMLMMFLSNELPFQQAFNWAAQRHMLRRLIGWRNFVVGPISEEFVFRACMIAIVAKSGASREAMIFGMPFVFGIAHIHHAHESYVTKGRTRRALMNAAMVSLLQLAYTTLFGWFATFLFLRTSNLVGPCLCHSFCNMMGFPDVTNIQYYGRWKNWLYLAFIMGVVLFGVLLMPLTDPRLYGDETSSAYWGLFMPTLPDAGESAPLLTDGE
ncbi:hypothetical protein BGZ83_010995 [Gryganskiella cystojenkinii]|nr:hypothetical protein BGZ83_010995 [Gryganskiella cystojenkinii]